MVFQVVGRRKKCTTVALFAGLALLQVSCAPGSPSMEGQQSGFLFGIWHGWIAPISIIWHFFFDPEVRIYDKNNSGFEYDLGYYIAIIAGFGSLRIFRRKRDKS
jgi:hypothetical protein